MTRTLAPLTLFLGLLLAAGAAAQEEATAFDVSLANPGARSLGFGGAFVALADDATSAFANPAGLAQLLEPEISFEIRIQGVDPGDRSVGGLAISTDQELSGLGFLAFVYPWKRVALAVYHNSFANLTVGSRIAGTAGGRAFTIFTGNELAVFSTGISLSYRLSEDLSLGAGVGRWEGNLDAGRFSTLTTLNPLAASEQRLTAITTTDDADLTFNVGLLWRFAEQWRLGGVYRGGPEFGLRSEARAGPPPVDVLPPQVRRFPFLLPDVLALGVAFKSPQDALTLSFEWDLVRYSRLLDSLEESTGRRGFALDDGHELHLGFEYVVVRSRPVIALRLGTWREPDHRLRYLGADPVDRATFRGGSDEIHFAAGLGFAWKSLKLDLAADWSDVVSTGSFSLVYSF